MNNTKIKAELPASIRKEMKMWRAGFAPMPKSYIEFHKKLAEQELEELSKTMTIHNQFMDGDGWMDGMRVLFVIAERNRELIKLHWHDGNQEFFIQLKSGGSCPFRLN